MSGTASCDRYYQSIAHLPPALIGQRALTCIALICATFGLLAGIASTNAVNMGMAKIDLLYIQLHKKSHKISS